MHALRLTTRFKEEAYQGEACLLVYDEQQLSGTMLSEDVRDQFDERPATTRIYILAPFISEKELRACFPTGTLFERVKSHFHPVGGRLFILTFGGSDGEKSAYAIPFTVNEKGEAIEEQPQTLDPVLKNGWLFDLFDKYRGRLDAPVGVHFSKSSGKHSVKFLRTSAVLLESTACAVVGYFVLTSICNFQPKRIFVDTAPLIAVAFAIQRIAIKNNLWELATPVASFSSYGGISGLPDPSSKDLILISASTSGGLVKTLKEMAFETTHIATLFFLQSTNGSETGGAVVCDLTFKRGQSFGYPPVESYTASNCPLCKKGHFLAELEGDQFQLEKRAVKRLLPLSKSQSDDARKTLELLARKRLIHVKIFEPRPSSSMLSLNADDMLMSSAPIRTRFIRHLRRFIPMPLKYVVLVGLREQTVTDLVKEADIENFFVGVTVIEYSQLNKVPQIEGGGTLVLFGYLDDFARARDINAQLRTIVPKGCVTYLSAITIANSAEHLFDLRACSRSSRKAG